jgi:hypothetical protein
MSKSITGGRGRPANDAALQQPAADQTPETAAELQENMRQRIIYLEDRLRLYESPEDVRAEVLDQSAVELSIGELEELRAADPDKYLQTLAQRALIFTAPFRRRRLWLEAELRKNEERFNDAQEAYEARRRAAHAAASKPRGGRRKRAKRQKT